MSIKLQNIRYVPLFEEHKAINERFNALPEQMKSDLATIFSLDENVIVCGSLGLYLVGISESLPNNIDIIVGDSSALKLVECELDVNYPQMVIDDVHAQPAQAQHEEHEEAQHQHQPVQPAETDVVIITVDPNGEISTIGEPRAEGESGYYDEDGTFHFENFKWMKGKPEGVKGSVSVFETCNKVKTMPIALGGITILVEEPGVMAEYKAKFAKLKGSKASKVKNEKPNNFDDKNQPHVDKNNTQEPPTE